MVRRIVDNGMECRHKSERRQRKASAHTHSDIVTGMLSWGSVTVGRCGGGQNVESIRRAVVERVV